MDFKSSRQFSIENFIPPLYPCTDLLLPLHHAFFHQIMLFSYRLEVCRYLGFAPSIPHSKRGTSKRCSSICEHPIPEQMLAGYRGFHMPTTDFSHSLSAARAIINSL